MKVQLQLQGDDPGLLNEFANSIETRRRVLNLLLNRDYFVALKAATELIEMLKMEYHLK
jgi:predicted transcriptional regulator